MKILLVAHRLAGNDGWSRYALNLHDALVARGHTITVVTPPPPLTFLTRPWRSFFLARKLRNMMHDTTYNVLHITVEPYALAALFLPKRIAEKIVLTVHGNYGIRPFRLQRTRWMMQRVFARIPRFITVSAYTKQAVMKELERMGKQKLARRFDERATVIHNGIPLPFSSSERNRPHHSPLFSSSERNRPHHSPLFSSSERCRSIASREVGRTLLDSSAEPVLSGVETADSLEENHPPSVADASLEQSTKHILHIGGVKPAKGVGEAIEACSLYKEKYGTPFHLTIIGSFWRDHYVQGLELLIHEKNLKDCVSFRGQISDAELIEEYRKADLLLVPSVTVDTTFEGFGLVYLESNAYGVPVIGPHMSGAAEAIKDGVSGYQIDVFHPEMIATRIHWILDEGRITSAACRKWAEEHSMEKVVAEVEEVYAMAF